MVRIHRDLGVAGTQNPVSRTFGPPAIRREGLFVSVAFCTRNVLILVDAVRFKE